MSATLNALEDGTRKLIDLMDEVAKENAKLHAEVRKLGNQLGDALDEVYSLKVTIRERDEMIAELQQIQAMRRSGT